MFRIMYFSTAATELATEELDTILSTARRRNAADGITGLLMYHERSFLQILEGEEARVMQCFHRIGADPRHRNVLEMFRMTGSDRLFGDWAMGFARPEDFKGGNSMAVRAIDQIIEELPQIGRRDARAESVIRSFLGTFRAYGSKVA